MTVSTKDIQLKQLGTPEEVLPARRAFDMAASAICPAGTIVGLNVSGNAGPADGTTFTTVVGVAERGVDNSLGAVAALRVTAIRSVFAGFATTGTAIDKTKIGSKVYAVDNQTLSLTSTSNAFAGYVDEVDPISAVPYYSIAVHVQGS